MLAKGLFTNILLVALSVGIFLTYLRPTFALIEVDQNSITQYEQEITKVQSVNARLNQLASEADQLSIEDRERMFTYLPNEVDTIAVQRDLYLMARAVGIELQSLSSVEPGNSNRAVVETGEASAAARSLLVPYQFEVEFSASYDVLKQFLALLEQNHYPLQVTALDIGVSSGEVGEEEIVSVGSLATALTITTYALQMQESAY